MAVAIYYSVGQNTSDHKTGSPTLTISSGMGTFSVAQTAANMGVGDRVVYDTDKVAYISGKTSTSVWTLITKTGGTPDNITDASVASISHAFASLAAAVGGATPGAADADHLNTANLTSGDFKLCIVCYYDDGYDSTSISISAFTTDSTRYVYIFTPHNTGAECNQPQRHSGKWAATGAYTLSGSSTNYAISTLVNNIIFHGLQIEYTGTSGSSSGLFIQGSQTGFQILCCCIIKPASGEILGRGISTGGTQAHPIVINNIIYGVINGIYLNNTYGSFCVYNNVISGCTNGIALNDTAPIIAKNNVLYNCTTPASGTFAAGTDYNSTDNAAIGYTVDGEGNTHDRVSQTFSFVDAVNHDYHLQSNDTGALDHGVDLSSDSYYPFNFDIDGDTRSAPWSIGADEPSSGSLVKVCVQSAWWEDPNWWQVGGINPANYKCAYAAKGAASQAASYVNLANPGTYDCGTASAPGWNADDGWIFDGTNQSLFNTLLIPATQNWSVICEFSDLTNDGILFGCGNYGGKYFMIQPNNSDLFCRFLNGSGVGLNVPPRVTSGIVGFAGNKAYINGVQVAGNLPDLSVAITNSFYIGCRNMGAHINFVAVKMRRLAILDTVLTPEQMAALAGYSFVEKPLMVYNGENFVPAMLKRYNGASWVTV